MQETRKKQAVAQQFSRASQSYDAAAHVQHHAAELLLNTLDHIQGHWLDLGCGTGFAVPGIVNNGADRITGLDIAEGMVTFSQHKWQHLPFKAVQGDAEDMPFEAQHFEGIFSNLMMQWSEQLPCLVNEMHRVLKPKGQVLVATLGPNTMIELKHAWEAVDPFVHVNQFHTLAEIEANFNRQFDIQSICNTPYVQHFNSMNSLLKELKSIGATNVNRGRRPGLGGRKRLQALEHAYRQQNSDQDSLPLTYDLIWFKATAR